jgi:acyl transferase domain-containing protein
VSEPATECGRCEAPTADGAHLCTGCTRKLTAALWQVPEAALDLEDAETRQTRVRRPESAGGAGRSLVWDEAAAKAREQLQTTLTRWVTWTREAHTVSRINPDPDARAMILTTAPQAPRTQRPADLAAWLTRFTQWLRHRPESTQLYAELQDALTAAREAVDAPERIYFHGYCLHKDDEHGTCTARLYTAESTGPITCPRCSHVHEARTLRDKMLAAAHERMLTATEVTRLLSRPPFQLIGAHDVANWTKRGILTPTGKDPRGRALYRVGDVILTRAEMDERHNRKGTTAA